MPRPSPSSTTSCAKSSTSRASTSSSSRRRPPPSYGITHRLSVNARAAGPRLGKRVQQAIQAAQGRGVERARRHRRGPHGRGRARPRARRVRPRPGDLRPARGRGARAAAAGRIRPARHHHDPRTGSRGARAGSHPGHPGHAQGRRLRRQRPHPPRTGRSRTPLTRAAVTSAFDIADIAGETLATEHAISVDGQASTRASPTIGRRSPQARTRMPASSRSP